jgi:hypothetical protein
MGIELENNHMFMGKKGLITDICHGILRLVLLQVVSCFKSCINKSGSKAQAEIDW